MTRRLFILSGLMFVGIVGMFLVGVAGNAPALLMLSIMCVTPLFFMALGAAIGRASTDWMIVERKALAKQTTANNTTVRTGRVTSGEPLG